MLATEKYPLKSGSVEQQNWNTIFKENYRKKLFHSNCTHTHTHTLDHECFHTVPFFVLKEPECTDLKDQFFSLTKPIETSASAYIQAMYHLNVTSNFR